MKLHEMTITSAGECTQIGLRRGAVVSFGKGRHIMVKSGDVWLTAEGQPDDQILRAGEESDLRGRHFVAQALSDAELCVA